MAVAMACGSWLCPFQGCCLLWLTAGRPSIVSNHTYLPQCPFWGGFAGLDCCAPWCRPKRVLHALATIPCCGSATTHSLDQHHNERRVLWGYNQVRSGSVSGEQYRRGQGPEMTILLARALHELLENQRTLPSSPAAISIISRREASGGWAGTHHRQTVSCLIRKLEPR